LRGWSHATIITEFAGGAGARGPTGAGAPFSYDWAFGDGGTSSLPDAPHAYADNGSYPVQLIISDALLRDTASTTATIANISPTATFNNPAGTTPVNEGSPFTLSLTGIVDPSTVDVAAGFSFAFDCGTGLGAFGPSPSISCPTVDNGPRTVSASVRDKDGGTTSYSGTARVKNIAPTVAITRITPSPAPRNTPYKISLSFSDPGTIDNPWTVTTTWGNGTTTTMRPVQGTVQLQRTYTAAGTYTIKVTVKDKNGAVGTSNSLSVKVQ